MIIRLSLILFFLCIATCSCKKDFLDTPSSTSGTAEEFVTSLDACQQLLNDGYLRLSASVYHGLNLVYPELIADNVMPSTGSTTLIDQYSWMQTATEGANTAGGGPNMNGFWTNAYAAVRQVAYVLENVDRFQVGSEIRANNIKGQALALRALIHFQLVNTFAQPYNFSPNGAHPGIPYIKSTDLSLDVKRENVGAVYTEILNDLSAAVSVLDPASTSKSVINLNAAKAMLARVYLYMGDYRNAKNLSTQVISNVPIMSENYPDNLFTLSESEALFQVLPLQEGLNGTSSSTFAGVYFSDEIPTFVATADIVNLLASYPSDLRNKWYDLLPDGSYRITKFPKDVIPNFNNISSSYCQTLLRSSEMYLIAAESYARLANFDSARYFLNQIHLRAIPDAVPIVALGEPLLDSISVERRKELCFEGFRMFDLLRNKKGVARMDNIAPDIKNLPYPSNKAIAPIPLVDVSTLGLEQNVGY